MIVFLGDTGSKSFLERMKKYGIGRVFATRLIPYEGEIFAIDNQCYAAHKKYQLWDEYKYLQFIEKAVKKLHDRMPYFSTIPDIVGEKHSLDYSIRWLDSGLLPKEWPWYLVLQDGMDPEEIKSIILERKDIKGLFLGGTKKFKEETDEIYQKLAVSYGKKFHYGRTSPLEKVAKAYHIGADSCDSNYFLYEAHRFDGLCNLISKNFELS